MWTSENRPKYNRDKLRYPSDLTDDEVVACRALVEGAIKFIEYMNSRDVEGTKQAKEMIDEIKQNYIRGCY